GRILGMGDVVSLVEKAAANIDAEKAARAAEKMRKGQFDLSDMREQLLQMANMGGISGLMGMMPGIAKMKNQIANAGLDDKILKRRGRHGVARTDEGAGRENARGIAARRRNARAAKGSSRRAPFRAAEFARAYRLERQAEFAGPRRLPRIGEEEMRKTRTSFVIPG